MRKLYALAVWMLILLAAAKTNGQSILSPQDLSSDISTIITVTNEIMAGDEDRPEETCRADFEVSNLSSSLLAKKFTAIPWHSEQKRPVLICWKFGDGTDTCIQYSNTNPGPYSVIHQSTSIFLPVFCCQMTRVMQRILLLSW